MFETKVPCRFLTPTSRNEDRPLADKQARGICKKCNLDLYTARQAGSADFIFLKELDADYK
jgi:hypothetical protein